MKHNKRPVLSGGLTKEKLEERMAGSMDAGVQGGEKGFAGPGTTKCNIPRVRSFRTQQIGVPISNALLSLCASSGKVN